MQEVTAQDTQLLLPSGRLVQLTTGRNYLQDAVGAAGR
jgi:hypothetical protein